MHNKSIDWFVHRLLQSRGDKNFSQISEAYLPHQLSIPANMYLFKFNNRNTRKRCEIRSKLTIKLPELLD